MASFDTWLRDPKNQSTINTGITAIGGAIAAGGAASAANRANQTAQANNAFNQLGVANQQLANANRDVAGAAGDQYTQWLNDQRARSQGVINARPLGAEQGYEQRNATMAALLPGIARGLANQPRPNDPAVAAMMPDLSFNIDPAALQRLQGSYSQDNTARAIAQFNNDLSSLSLGQQAPNLQMEGLYGGNPYAEQMGQFQNQQATQAASREAEMRAKVQAALDQNVSGANDYVKLALEREQKAQEEAKKKSGGVGGFLKGLGKGALKVGAIAAPFVLDAVAPGMGSLARAGITGALGAASGAASGGGIRGTVLGGAGGAVGGVKNIPGLNKLGTTGAQIARGALQGGISGGAQGAFQGGLGGYLGGRFAPAGPGQPAFDPSSIGTQVNDYFPVPPDYFMPRGRR